MGHECPNLKGRRKKKEGFDKQAKGKDSETSLRNYLGSQDLASPYNKQQEQEYEEQQSLDDIIIKQGMDILANEKIIISFLL